MKVLPRRGQEENLNLREDKAVKACNGLRGGHPPAAHTGKARASSIFQALDLCTENLIRGDDVIESPKLAEMIGLLCFALAVLTSPFKSKLRLGAENAVLRHQLIVSRRRLHGCVRPHEP
jgi:hypothetical protein